MRSSSTCLLGRTNSEAPIKLLQRLYFLFKPLERGVTVYVPSLFHRASNQQRVQRNMSAHSFLSPQPPCDTNRRRECIVYTAISRKVVVKQRKTVSYNTDQLVLTQTLFSFCRTKISKQLYPYTVDLQSYEPHADLYFKPSPPFSKLVLKATSVQLPHSRSN